MNRVLGPRGWAWLQAWMVSFCTIAAGASLAAATFVWRDGVSGDFADPNRWLDALSQPGVPGPGDVALFRVPAGKAAYTVRVLGATTAETEFRDDVVFNLQGRYSTGPLRVTTAAVLSLDGEGSLTATRAAAPAGLTVSGGATLQVGELDAVLSIRHRGIVVLTRGDAPGALIEERGLYQYLGTGFVGPLDLRSGGRFEANQPVEAPTIQVRDSGSMVTLGAFVGGVVTLTSAGVLRSGPSTLLGGSSVLDGMASSWQVTGPLTSVGNYLDLTNGASLTAGSITLTPSCDWRVTSRLSRIGIAGTLVVDESFLTVSDAGTLTGGNLEQGVGIVRVTGAGSLLEFPDFSRMTNGQFMVHTGAVARFGRLLLTGGTPSAGSVEVRGPDARLQSTDRVEVAVVGNGNFDVLEGGRVESPLATIGSGPNGNGSVRIDGAGSGWQIGKEGIIVGGRFGRAVLHILGGGSMELGTDAGNDGPMIVGDFAGTGSILVRDAPSRIGARQSIGIHVGEEGTGSLTLQAGGQLVARDLVFGFGATGVGTGNIAGGGSAAEILGSLTIGEGGAGTVGVANGGQIRIGPNPSAVRLGRNLGSRGSLAIRSAGSGVDAGMAPGFVGEFGTGQLILMDRARAALRTLTVGMQAGATGLVSVADAGSALLVDQDLYVGLLGEGRIEILSGGTFTLPGSIARVGIAAGPKSLGTIRVNGGSSVADFPGRVAFVGTGGYGRLEVTAGGRLSVAALELGTSANAADARGEIEVQGLGSRLEIAESLSVIGAAPGEQPFGVRVFDSGLVTVGRQVCVAANNGLAVIPVVGMEPRPAGGSLRVGSVMLTPVEGEVWVTDGGALLGAGRVTAKRVLALPGGRVQPGCSIGRLQIDGDLFLEAGSDLAFELAGPEPGVEYDTVGISGTATLLGRLELNFIDGFAPTNGQRMTLVHGALNLAARPESVSITGLAAGFTYDLPVAPDGSLALVATNDGVPTTAPRLSVVAADGSVVVGWPVAAGGYRLERTASLGPGAAWRAVAAKPEVRRQSFEVRLPVAAVAEFYRLVRP